MFIKFNPNPLKKNTGDCVIRAICSALEIDWDKAFMKLCVEAFILRDMPSSNAVWDSLLLKEGFSRNLIPFDRYYTVKDFCNEHSTGTYILGTGSHAVAVINGNYYDAWDSGNEIPTYYYRKDVK